jgi:restriction system protein
MSLWLVRAGENGEHEEFALERSCIVLDKPRLPDLSIVESEDVLQLLLNDRFQGRSAAEIAGEAEQAWVFAREIALSDIVILPMKTVPLVAVAAVTGPYRYVDEPDARVRHVRPVGWIRVDLPRNVFWWDLLDLFDCPLSVRRLTENNAEARVSWVASQPLDQLHRFTPADRPLNILPYPPSVFRDRPPEEFPKDQWPDLA